jgi:signal transduction histidine kinase/ActR/RegA family two-component response regulator
MFQRLQAWFNRIPIDDPVDRRNAIFMQWLLLFEGLRIPLNKIYLLLFVRPYLEEAFYDKARAGADVAAVTDIGTDLAMTVSAWLGLYLIRKGRFRPAVSIYVAVVLGSGALAYAAFGYQATDGNLTLVAILALSGMMLGRRALWITYGVEVLIFAIGVTPIQLFRGHRVLHEVMKGYDAIPVQTLMSYLLITIVLDRSINALRESLTESNLQRQQLKQEITERERTQEQLLHARKMDAIGKLASGIAHDINNVFGIILGFAMERDRLPSNKPSLDQDTEAMADALEGVELAARRGTAVCRKLLNFSRRDITHAETFDASAALRELRPLLRQLMPPTIHLDIRTSNRELPIRFDRSQFELAILNLASNARDAMPDGGSCVLSITQEASSAITVSIQDSGCGMPDEIKARLFEPFFTTKPVGSGTGLGLSVVYGLVQRAGGDIVVDSTLGKGSTFCIRLPVTDSTAASAQPSLPEGRIRVLLIDDDDDLRALLASALINGGCEVSEAASGAETEQLVRHMTQPPHVLVCDHRMPDTDGSTLLRKLRQSFRTVPAILISAYIDTDGSSTSQVDPHSERLPKPFAPDVLLARVISAARRGQAEQAASSNQ